jgi:type I restriction enzyme M protein
MDRRRAPPGRDPLHRFYSGNAVGHVVAEAVSEHAPGSVVDLGSGSGVLAAAASARWPSVHVTTLDVDPAAAEASRRNGHRHLPADVLGPALQAATGLARVDVVLSNPPFGIAPAQPHHVDVLAAAGLPTDAPGSLELLFAAQALLLAKDGGSVVLVLSDGFATGRRNAGARRAILASHRIASVTQMPPGSFRGTEAGGFVLSLVKGAAPAQEVLLRRAKADGTTCAEMRVSRAEAAERLDHGFHAAMRTGPAGPTLRDLGASVVRGSCEPGGSALPRDLIFHTTDFPRSGPRSVELPPSHADRPAARIVLAEPGDVLVARLGRGLERKVCLIAGGWAAPSSAVLRIRLPAGTGEKVADALLSPGGAERLSATSRGTGARMLGREDLLAMPLPL